MKGALSNPNEKFIYSVNKHLFQKSQYRFNSGGDPKAIPSLEYEDLCNFQSKYYHPSNSTFLSYGDLDFTKHLNYLD